VRPTVRFLTDDLIKQIIDEAVNILCTLGLQIHNKQILSMLADHRAGRNYPKGVKNSPPLIQTL